MFIPKKHHTCGCACRPGTARSGRGGDPRASRSSSEMGFSLVELLLISAAVLIVCIGVAELLVASLDLNRNGDFSTVAAGLAVAKIEELRQYAYDDPELAAGAYEDSESPSGEAMRRVWTIEENVPRTGIKRIRVTVTPPWAGSGPRRAVALVTYRTSAAFADSISP